MTKSEGIKKSAVIRGRVTDDELAVFRRMMDLEGLNQSELLRHIIRLAAKSYNLWPAKNGIESNLAPPSGAKGASLCQQPN